jgi:hypothetical protein
MFFGWGKKNISKALPNKQVVILNYRYFNLMFIFSLAFGYKYSIATPSDKGWHYKDITAEEAQRLMAGEVLQPNWWIRYSLFIALAGIALTIVTGVLTSGS